jgi:uncharacterized protein YyaL (SSP411 family)
MADEPVHWGRSVDEALATARSENKLVLIDLFNPN